MRPRLPNISVLLSPFRVERSSADRWPARRRSVRHLTTSLLAFVFVGCSSSPTTRQPGPMDTELLVAASTLSDFVGEPDSLGVLRLHRSLQARTAQFPDSAAWTAATDGFGLGRTHYPSLVASYWRANRHARSLYAVLPVPGWRVQLVDAAPEQSSNVGTVHYVSRTGFAPTGDSALVAVDALCGPLCGRGALLLYVRNQNGWRLASTLQLLQY